MTESEEPEAGPSSTRMVSLGAFIKKARQDLKMTLRDVEVATAKEVSNGYLSQLESDKISKPSPHVLYALASVLRIDYEVLMQRAGYILPGGIQRQTGAKHGKAATFAIDNLTAEEESELLDYLSYIRSKKK